jgi:hypothetical protein
MDSALRHLQAYAGGEEVDAETGCHHLGHAVWNVKVLLEQVLKEKGQPQRRKLCSDMDTSAIEKYVMKRTPNMEFVVAPPEDVTGGYDADVHVEGSPEHLAFLRRFANWQKSLPKWGKMTLAGEDELSDWNVETYNSALTLKSNILGDSVILNRVRRPVHTETTPRPITPFINNLETVGGSVKSRLVLTIDLEKLMRSCPPEIRGDLAKEQEWVEKARASCADSLKEVNEKTALILFDVVKAEYLHYVDSSSPQGHSDRESLTRKELSQLLNKNISYVEKMKDGQVVVLDGTEFVVRGD